MIGGAPSTLLRRRAGGICIFLSIIFVLLSLRIFFFQTFQFNEFEQNVIDQITQETSVSADRGNIYDKNGIVIATNVTTYRLFVDPAVIMRTSEKDGVNYKDIIAKGLSSIESLGITYDDVMKQMSYTKYRDRTVARHISEEQADAVRLFIEASGIDDKALVFLQATSKRYYPYDGLASHVLGFTGSDGAGLYGLELAYNELLSGTDGKYIGAKDSYGNEMVYDYESYIPAIDGYNVTTTIDVYIQAELEEQLKATYIESGGKKRATGIVMDVDTGAVLAMAVYPSYDLNDPRTLNYECQERYDYAVSKLNASALEEGSDEFKAYALELFCDAVDMKPKEIKHKLETREEFTTALKQELLLYTWNNKAINDLYMPGSTFKVITSAMAYEENIVIDNEKLECKGYYVVNGRKIKCHVHEPGHGWMTYARGLQQSCNPALMQMGLRLGADKYLEYFEAFGYFEKSGIDVKGESYTQKGSTFWDDETFKSADIYLATASFGQNFKISALSHLTAISAVANGGDLVTPYFVEKVTDNDGNVVYSHEVEVRRQVISSDTAKKVSNILAEGVATDGGSKNAYVAGYRIAAKTGTSEKKDTEREGYIPYVCSAIAYAPAEKPEIASIILVDEPTEGVLYASVMAAPYIGALFEEILPYCGVEAKYTDEELDKKVVETPALVSSRLPIAVKLAKNLGFDIEIVGDGAEILDADGNIVEGVAENVYIKAQSPAAFSQVDPSGAKIILYTTKEAADARKTVKVPDLTGKTAAAANGTLISQRLNIKISGANISVTNRSAVVYEQFPAAGEEVYEGTVVELYFRFLDGSDQTYYDPDADIGEEDKE